MEDDYSLELVVRTSLAAPAGHGGLYVLQEEVGDLFWSDEIGCTIDVPAVVLVVEAAINDVELLEVVIKVPSKKILHLVDRIHQYRA